MRPLCIVVTGDPVPRTLERRGGFADLIRATTGTAWSGPWSTYDARGDTPAPKLERVAGLIVTGSASSVTSREPWILAVERYLADAADKAVPVLGICFGHQLLGQALGGRVERNPRGREMGTVEIDLVLDDPLLDGSSSPYLAQMSHQDSIVDLPSGSRVLARSAREPYAALRFAERAWGVQFHPEFDRGVIADYVEARRQALLDEGQDAAEILSFTRETPAASSVLRRFVAHLLT